MTIPLSKSWKVAFPRSVLTFPAAGLATSGPFPAGRSLLILASTADGVVSTPLIFLQVIMLALEHLERPSILRVLRFLAACSRPVMSSPASLRASISLLVRKAYS